MNNQSQIDQNEPRSASKVILEASRFEVAQKGAKSFHKFEIFGATWGILGAILAPVGRQGDPKIEHFGIGCAPRSSENRKNWHQESSKVGKSGPQTLI